MPKQASRLRALDRWAVTLAAVVGLVAFTQLGCPAPETVTRSPPYSLIPPLSEPIVFAPGVVSTHDFELGTSFAPEAVSFTGSYRDIDPFVSPDGSELFFQSDRPLAGSEANDSDIWVSEKTADGWGEPRNLGPPINTGAVETFPVVSGDGSLYFSSDREGGHGEGDIYRARLVDGAYLEPENIGPPLNTTEFDSNAVVSADGSYLILASSS